MRWPSTSLPQNLESFPHCHSPAHLDLCFTWNEAGKGHQSCWKCSLGLKNSSAKRLVRQLATAFGDGLADWLLGGAWEGRKEGARGRGSRGTGTGLHSRELPRACLLKLVSALRQLSFNPTPEDTSWHQCRSNSPGHVSHQAGLQVCSSGVGTFLCVSFCVYLRKWSLAL